MRNPRKALYKMNMTLTFYTNLKAYNGGLISILRHDSNTITKIATSYNLQHKHPWCVGTMIIEHWFQSGSYVICEGARTSHYFLESINATPTIPITAQVGEYIANLSLSTHQTNETIAYTRLNANINIDDLTLTSSREFKLMLCNCFGLYIVKLKALFEIL